MSGNNRQGRQGGQQPQGGQPRGGQPQQGQRGQQPQGGQPRGGQPRQGQRGQPPQGGGRPPRRGGGGGGGIDTGGITNIVIWGVAAFAIAGLVFGLLPVLFGVAGDTNGSTELVSANSTAAQEQAEDTEAANEIVESSLSDDNLSAANAYDQKTSQNRVIIVLLGTSTNFFTFGGLIFYLAVLFAVVCSVLIGVTSSADEKTLAAGVGVAVLIGVVAFILVGSVVAGFQYNSMSEDDWTNEYNTNPNDWNPYPSSDFDQSASEDFQEADVSPDDASISSISTIDDLQINYGTLATNALLMAIITAIGTAGLAVVSKRLSGRLE